MRLTSLLFIVCLSIAPGAEAQHLTRYVDPFIGTGGHGHTYPGATVPFGMVQLSPDNGTEGWDWCSGYHYTNDSIQGFSHTHLSGTGIGDWCDILVMPQLGFVPATVQRPKTAFSHQNEKASPGFYSVQLSNGIKAELTATDRCGLHQYQFPKGSNPVILFDLGFRINWDRPTRTFIQQLNDSTIVGFRFSNGWATGQRVYFAARTSKPFNRLVDNNGNSIGMGDTIGGKNARAQLAFATGVENISMKLALSSVSSEKALAALGEIHGWNFAQVQQAAEAKWEAELSKMSIETKNETDKKIFYTALYHTCLAPVLYSDADGEYQNWKGNFGKMANGQQRYTVYSLWDTFRALNPLFTVLRGDAYTGMLNTMLRFQEENGLLPIWDLSTWETNTMTGYHAIPVLADAILKDWPGLDANQAYAAMKKSATQEIRGTPFYRQYGYLPQDKVGSSVTITVEYAFDDWCIAQVAKKLGHHEDYLLFMKRSQSWQNLFDAASGFIRAKNSDGSWVTPFDPYLSEHDEHKAMYTEGNAWQHSFFVPHDVRGLAAAHGGTDKFVQKLDSLFSVSSKLSGSNTSPDVSGLIGQYAHGNEPSHHIAYLYAVVGQPARTAERVKQILDTMYQAKPDGYAGNEDCGQMSAWAVWSMAGLYPENPASGQYVFGTPRFEQVDFNLPSGKKFSIVRKGKGIYIQKALLNGQPYTKLYLAHSSLMAGGELQLVMGTKPSKTWGTDPNDWPQSVR